MKRIALFLLVFLLIPVFAMAATLTVTVLEGDGDYILPTSQQHSNVQRKEFTSVTVEANVDAATILVGYNMGTEDAPVFKAYVDGSVTTTSDIYVRHGEGVALMIRVSGITANPVVVRYQ